MWERKYRKSHDLATEAELEQFNFAYNNVDNLDSNHDRRSPIPSPSPAASTPASPMDKRVVKAAKTMTTKAPPPFERPSIQAGTEVLASVSAQLHLFDAADGVFMLQDDRVISSVIETGAWECSFFLREVKI